MYICLVLKLKPILAILTLTAYFLTLGHSFIPHHHHEKNQAEHHHHHSHEGDNLAHDHVAHGNHFDENLIDYLACIFGEHHHSEMPCKVTEEWSNQKQSNKQFNSSDLTANSEINSGELFKSDTKTHYNFRPQTNFELLVNIIAKRGPPTA